MAEEIVHAAFHRAAREQFPPMFIATPRQVDADRGYTNWSQAELVEYLDRTAVERGYDGPYIVARDHGGPYQSTRDRGDPDVPLDTAMTYAKDLFVEDLKAGFDVLHVDATEDPRVDGVLDLPAVAERTGELVTFIEAEQDRLGVDPVLYEVGTEEIEGGMTDPESFERFTHLLADELPGDTLDRVSFVVGQVGTRMRIDMTNEFEPGKARELVEIARSSRMGLKVHYTDWLSKAELESFPELGIGAANVGPEFAAALISGLADLAERENDVVPGSAARSEFMSTLESKAIAEAPWEKFAPTGMSASAREEFVRTNRRNIALCVGRYELTDPDVESERELLETNIREHTTLDPQDFLIERIAQTIGRYVDSFDLAKTV
jgi:tagatose-1,6-bisphosphate aldolase non-catalytic subunit AgaZ/GatZ